MSRTHRSISKDPAKAFISTWNTATTYTGSSANNQIKLPLIATGLYKFTVQWGDGTSNLITSWNQLEVTHTYAAPGIYTVTITGFIKGWDFAGQDQTVITNVTGDRRKITSITQFGCLRLVTFESTTVFSGAFYGCTNLSLLNVTDMPNFKGNTSIGSFVRNYSLPTIANVNKWDVSKITWFRGVFRDAILFDQDLGNWNVSKGINFGLMFRGDTTNALIGSFNNGGSPSIGNWDMRNATSLVGMFISQRFFDQNIGNWDVSNVTDMSFMFTTYWSGTDITLPINAGYFNNGGSDSIKNWNTSKVTTMGSMFSGQNIFNQPIGDWDTSKVTNMSYMLQTKDFNQPIENWDVSKVTTMSRMLQGYNGNISFNQPLNNWKLPLVTDMVNFMRGGTVAHSISVQNYSDFLIALSQQPLKPNVQLGVNQYYDSSAVSARAILTSAPNNWTIIDFGLQP